MRIVISNVCFELLVVQAVRRIRKYLDAGLFDIPALQLLRFRNMFAFRCKSEPRAPKKQASFVIVPLVACRSTWLTTFQTTFQRVYAQPDFTISRTTKQSFV